MGKWSDPNPEDVDKVIGFFSSKTGITVICALAGIALLGIIMEAFR